MSRRWSFLTFLTLALVAASVLTLPAAAQPDIEFERSRMRTMLNIVAREVEKNFYDPELKGRDWKTLTEQTRKRIDEAGTVGDMFTAIYSMVNQLDDSHTVFIPPMRAVRVLFGFEAKPYKDEIRIYEVRKGSAAEKAGLKVGDRIHLINGFRAERNSFDIMMIYLRALRPVGAMEMVISRGGESPRTIRVDGQIKQGALIRDLTDIDTIYELIREAESEKVAFYYNRFDGDIGYLQLPYFSGDYNFVYGLLKKVDKSKAVIVDLRGNPGGSLNGLRDFTSHFEADKKTMAELHGRKKPETVELKPRKPAFPGPVIVLVDSQSASASEMFARHFQLSGRGVVIGDQTSGRVTAAKNFVQQMGADIGFLYGVQVAVARVVFPDGNELEKRGVTPDIACVPTQQQLAAEEDICLAAALKTARDKLGLPPLEEKKTEGETKN